MRTPSFVLLLSFSVLGARLSAQTVHQVSLEDAIRIADRTSEFIDVARAGVTRADGQQKVARSQFLPQLNASGSYARTLASQFEGFSFGGGPDTASIRALCAPNLPDNATPAERQAALDQSQSCVPLGTTTGGGADFSSVGFGALNQWIVGLQFSQNVFTGGRSTGQRMAANAGRRAADIELVAQRAQVALDATQAYYNAVLAGRLADIAQSVLTWNDEVLRQTTQARQVGSTSEFEVLRARVARDNQVPVLLQRRNDQVVAMLRLKQLLEFPLDDSLELTTSIDDAPIPTVAGVSEPGEPVTASDTAPDARATVRQAAENVTAQEGLLRMARSERFPTIAITSGYQRLFFPLNTFPVLTDFRENWTVGVSAGVSLFSGGRIRGNERVAQANLSEAKARLKQAKEFAALDARVALSQLAQAEATWKASQGTAEQAQRAYGIDQIRYREGISTQTDLTQSQLLVQQAMVNRAVAARDLAVARIRLALLKDLPLSASNTGGAPAVGAGATILLSPPPQQQPRTPGASSATGSNQQ
ncbi:MAG: TolC family protein [Gemmatimonadaceae bacterium]